jgi:hypothetical protein
MLVALSNVRSLRNKFDEIALLAENLAPDLMAFTETWLTQEIRDAEVQIPGYELVRSDRTAGSIHGGVILYIKHPTTFHVLETFHSEEGNEESLWCKIRNGPCSVTLGLIYRSPSATGIQILQQIEKYGQNNQCLILGDFNAPSIDWDTLQVYSSGNPFCHSLLNVILERCLVQHVSQPTRIVPGQTANILDLVLTRSTEDVTELQYHDPVGNSDHLLICFRYAKFCCAPMRLSDRRNVWKADLTGMEEAFRKTTWELPTNLGIEAAWKSFRDKFHLIANKFIPITKRHLPSKGPPWIDAELRTLLKKRRKMWDTFKRTREPKDYANYKTFRNICTEQKRIKRAAYEEKLAIISSDSSKPLFAYLKRKMKSGTGIPPLRSPLSEFVAEDDRIKADMLALQYSSVYSVEHSPFPNFHHQTDALVEDINFDEFAVKNQLQKLNPTSAPGPDDIHPYILRHLASLLAPPIYQIFRLSMDEGRLPSDWKVANIKPIFKGGDRHDPANYRPISLTSVVCKVFERIIRESLRNHLQLSGGLCPFQHGFRQGRSCITNLLTAREIWASVLDCGRSLDVVYVDFSKAFDKVPHRRLQIKLQHYGVRGKLLDWIIDFLSRRTAKVMVNGSLSAPFAITSGVPQGSVLGPELFSLFVSDLPSHLRADCLLYADDLKLWMVVSSVEEADELQLVLDRLFDWSVNWMLPINPEKCCVLSIGADIPYGTYHIGGRLLRISQQEKDLGVIVTSDFKSEAETYRKVTSATRLFYAVKRAFLNMSPTIFRRLYSAHIRPILEYGSPAWYPVTKQETDALERVQRRATKLVTGLYGLPYEERLLRLNLFSLAYRRRRGDLIYTRRILQGELGSTLYNLFHLNTDGPTRGHALKLYKPRRLRLQGKVTLSTRVVNDWNLLPAEAVGAKSEECFKKMIDEFLLTRPGAGCSGECC